MYKIKCRECGGKLTTLEEYLKGQLDNYHNDKYSLPAVTHKHLICGNCGHKEKIQIVLDRHVENFIDEKTGKKYPATNETQ